MSSVGDNSDGLVRSNVLRSTATKPNLGVYLRSHSDRLLSRILSGCCEPTVRGFGAPLATSCASSVWANRRHRGGPSNGSLDYLRTLAALKERRLGCGKGLLIQRGDADNQLTAPERRLETTVWATCAEGSGCSPKRALPLNCAPDCHLQRASAPIEDSIRFESDLEARQAGVSALRILDPADQPKHCWAHWQY